MDSEAAESDYTLTGLDADLHDALAECGRIIEAMPWDERRERVDQFLTRRGMLEGLNREARNFVIGVMIVANSRRLADEHYRPGNTPVEKA